MLLYLLLAILLCLGLSFFFSGSETAVISVNRYRLRSLHEQGDPDAGRVLGMLSNTQRLLIMVLIGTNLANVLAALFFRTMLEREVIWADNTAIGAVRWSELLSLLLLTPIVIVFAEVLPKAIFRAHADRLIGRLRPVFAVCLGLFYPLIWLVEHVARLVLGPLTEARSRAVRRLTRQDVMQLIKPEDRSAEERAEETEAGTGDAGTAAVGGQSPPAAPSGASGGLSGLPFEEGDERQMVENVLRLNETIAEEIMTPLVELEAVRLGQVDLEALRRMAIASGYSRFPVFRDRIVHIVGFIDIYRVLREFDGSQTIEDFIERPHYVPATKRVDDLLQEFLDLRIKNAIVVDEYGGCCGWISREDIIEEIVGELQDELDEPHAPIRQTAEATFTVDGRTEIDDLNGHIGADFSDKDWETVAGLVLSEMGRIPKVGDEVTIDGWRAKVIEMDRLRIGRVELRRIDV
jgi:CBS domain containing-hemolysin-like protein